MSGFFVYLLKLDMFWLSRKLSMFRNDCEMGIFNRSCSDLSKLVVRFYTVIEGSIKLLIETPYMTSCYWSYALAKVFTKERTQSVNCFKGYTVVPVPLSLKRHEERGFNQVSAMLDAAGIPYQDFLSKKEIEKQSVKGRQDRLSTENPFSSKVTTKYLKNYLLLMMFILLERH